MPKLPSYYYEDTCDLDAFITLVEQSLDAGDFPHASSIEHNIPIYDMAALSGQLKNTEQRQTLMSEWAYALGASSGILVLKNAYQDTSVIDQASEIYHQVIADEKGKSGADHFAAAGNNDRIWNSLQKLCEVSPEVFVRYFGNLAIDAVSEAWLGPNYQMTAQVNLVRPGGKAQLAHRDYHLGFQTAAQSSQYPAHVHHLSPVMTLQGAVAHCDMPLESGPTKLLPFSQLYLPGYAAWRRDDFRAYFEKHYVQLPLSKGDALFFNPAVFHGAGDNTSKDINRMGNLLQVSSAFGRAMETVNREKMCELVFESLKEAKATKAMQDGEINAAIACTGEGYSFPTNLDTDPPVDGLAPQTQQQLLQQGISEGWSLSDFKAALSAQSAKRES